jgi:dienelactone hydrolase
LPYIGNPQGIDLGTREANVVTQTKFTSQGVSITGELYTPVATTKTGLVVIAYGTDGLTDHLTGPWETMIRDYAESLGSSGFVAMIPDFLGVTSTMPGEAVLASLTIAEANAKQRSRTRSKRKRFALG